MEYQGEVFRSLLYNGDTRKNHVTFNEIPGWSIPVSVIQWRYKKKSCNL